MAKRSQTKSNPSCSGFIKFVLMGLLAYSSASFGLSRERVLSDPLDRISSAFEVPESLRDRTHFWFDVYTKYDSNTHVFHHKTYPWIVFLVVDTTDIIKYSEGNFWNRYFRAQDFVAQERKRVTKALESLARRKNFKNMSPLEASLFEKLEEVPGKRQTVFKQARQDLRNQLGQKDYFLKALANSRKYMAYMEQEFARQGLPKELVRLPFVESSFNEAAKSRVGASGIWQIMPATGKAYGMVTDRIDDRNSPLKATRIAGVLFRSYHKALDAWPLTITAYNHGIGSMMKAVRKLKTQSLDDVIARYKASSFGFASSNFFTCFLAALYAEVYHDKIFTDQNLVKARLMVREIVKLDRSMRMNEVIQIARVTRDQVFEFNRDLVPSKARNLLFPRGYELHLPVGHRKLLLAELEKERSRNRAARTGKVRSASL